MTYMVSAYAAAAAGLDEAGRDDVYAELRQNPLVRGFEIPFSSPWDAGDVAALARRTGPDRDVLVTTVPGLFRGALSDPTLGPASLDPDGRRRAVEFLRAASTSVDRLADEIGPQHIAGIAITSSPRRVGAPVDAAARAFQDSLAQLVASPRHGFPLLVEHCDALLDSHPSAKGYLPLEVEIDAIKRVHDHIDAPVQLAINWARSVIEGRASDTAEQHVESAARSGLLAALFFSGCSPQESRYGGAWADAHLPSRAEEPLSLLSTDAMRNCIAAANPAVILGLKVAAPRSMPVKERIQLVERELARLATTDALASRP